MAKKKETSMDDLRDTLFELKDQLKNLETGYVNKAKKKAVDVEKDFENKVEENPMKSVGISFGAGLLVGAALLAFLKK